jgi:hypothetical protein
MAKQRRRNPTAAGKRAAAPPAPTTLLELTQHGFDALKARRQKQDGSASRPSASARAFGEALDRLKADYARLLRPSR